MDAAAKSSPCSAMMRSSRLCALRCHCVRVLCCSVKPALLHESAMRRNASSQCAYSVASVFKNLRRAGVLKYKSRTSTVVPAASAVGSAAVSCGPSALTAHACFSPSRLLDKVRRDTAAMLASASPRNPRLPTRSRSSSDAILLVAWRASASASSSRAMPLPLSLTFSNCVPPAASCTVMLVAPASRLFSSSSLSADAGRSTTSPAAIWLISRSGRT